MDDLININTVKELIDSDVSALSIANEIGISQQTILNYRNGKADFMNMTLKTAIKLQEYQIKRRVIKMKANEILNTLKQNEVDFVLSNGKGEVYSNESTGNFMSMFSQGDFYGVYSDKISFGQIDSRTSSDDEILKAIEKLLSYDEGIELIKREDSRGLERTYMQ